MSNCWRASRLFLVFVFVSSLACVPIALASASGTTTVTGWNPLKREVRPGSTTKVKIKIHTGSTYRKREVILLGHAPGEKWKTVSAKSTNRHGSLGIKLKVGSAPGASYEFKFTVKRTRQARGYSSAVMKLLTKAARQPPQAPDNRFQAVYATTADQTAEVGKDAAIRATLEEVNRWFASQTVGGVQPRWVRDGSDAIVVAHVPLPYTQTALQQMTHSEYVSAVTTATRQLTQTIPVIFVNTNNNDVCGWGGEGDSGPYALISEGACYQHPAVDAVFGLHGTRTDAHEMMHALGAVPSCAPHEGADRHVTDNARDLMYSGAQDIGWAPFLLDPGHDDYYNTPESCPDVQDSVYWELTARAVPPAMGGAPQWLADYQIQASATNGQYSANVSTSIRDASYGEEGIAYLWVRAAGQTSNVGAYASDGATVGTETKVSFGQTFSNDPNTVSCVTLVGVKGDWRQATDFAPTRCYTAGGGAVNPPEIDWPRVLALKRGAPRQY